MADVTFFAWSDPENTPSGFSSAIEKKLPSFGEDSRIGVKGIMDEAASRRLGVAAVGGAAAATGAVEVTWPIAAIAMAYIAGQTVVDTWGE